MIESFKDRRLKRLYEQGDASKLPPELVDRIITIIAHLDIALMIDDIRIHSNKLNPLRGDRKGYWSITVRANWRIIFKFKDGSAQDVELIDYH